MKNHNIGMRPKAVVSWLGKVCLAFTMLVFTSASAQEDAAPKIPCPKPYVKTISPRVAEPLQEVKIRGSRFGAELGSVTFTPDTTGKVVSWSNKRIHVEVPANAQTGPVTVTSQCGQTSNNVYFDLKGKSEQEEINMENEEETVGEEDMDSEEAY